MKKRADQLSIIEWSQERNEHNKKYFPIFLLVSTLGILSYAVFDIYSNTDMWEIFLICRIGLSINALILFFLSQRYSNYSQLFIALFFIPTFTFFAVGAAFMETETQVYAWNFSIILAGLLWPYFILVVRLNIVLICNLFYIFTYFLAYFLISKLAFSMFLVNGGLFFLLGFIASFFLAYSRSNMHYSYFLLKKELLTSNLELQNLNNALSNSNRAKDRFFSIVAHDLRSPFHGIIGFNNLVINELKRANLEQAKKYAEIVHKSSIEYYSFLSKLLEWAEAQSKRKNFQPESLELSDFSTDIIQLLKSTAERKQVTINNNIPEDIDVFADPHMLATILRNLLGNAIKFSPDHSLIVVDAENNGRETLISVKDQGVGMTQDQVKTVFDAAVTKSTKGTHQEKGAGLGLAICKEFVATHQGEIWVESEEGLGSTFTFSIPSAKAAPTKSNKQQ